MICPPDTERNFEVPFWVLEDPGNEKRFRLSDRTQDGLG